MQNRDILALTARQMAAAVRDGDLTARAIAEAHLECIEEADGPVMAWQHLEPSEALEAADRIDAGDRSGPLAGVPIGVKDVIETADMPTGYGTAMYDGSRPLWNAPCVQLAQDAGSLILGKTVSTELAMASPNKTRNPHNPAHTPGGSSSGSCAAVAAGMVPLAFGTQTSGSVIRPSSFCGVTALKPTFGLVNTVGIKVLCHGLDSLGIIGRNIGDVAACTAALSGRKELAEISAPQRPRLGVLLGTRLEHAEPCAIEMVERVAKMAEAAGADVTTIPVPDWFDGVFDLHEAVMGWEVTHSLAYEIRERWEDLTPVTRAMLTEQGRTTEPQYRAATQALPEIRRTADALFSQFDAVLTLAAPGEAPEGMPTGDPVYNRLWSVLHTPLIALPAGTGPRGLPVGVQLVGARGDDPRLAAAALFLEQCLATKTDS